MHRKNSPIMLEIIDLVKHFGEVKAVNGLSFHVQQGRCFGLLGPNGAGKTTTIEMMEGITKPTSGRVLYRGEVLGAQFRREAGIQFQATALQDNLTVLETLKLFRGLYEHPVAIDDLIEQCALSAFLKRDNRKLSGGQRQRLLLAIALVNNPEIVFLDEPTTGLDPQARRNFWELVRNIKSLGKTVLLTTHYMEEAEILCDDIAIVDYGKIIAQGAPRALIREHFSSAIIELPLQTLPVGLPLATHVREHGVEIIAEDIDAAIKTLITADVSLQGLTVRPPTLEDLFLELTGRDLRS